MDIINGESGLGKWRLGASAGMVPLFECMVRAIAGDPQRLDDLNNLIQDLKGHSETKDLLPDGMILKSLKDFQLHKEIPGCR